MELKLIVARKESYLTDKNGNFNLEYIVRSMFTLCCSKAPVTLYRIACVSDYFSYRIGVSFTLPRSDPVQHVGAKSLRSGGDTKSNPICAVYRV